jgi:predicted GNAT family acetyltransferase
VATDVRDNPEEHRYEAVLDGHVVGVAEYDKSADVIAFTHTVVQPSHEGEGIGGTLVRAALDDAQRQRLRVRPLCPFVRSWIEEHPDYAGLME